MTLDHAADALEQFPEMGFGRGVGNISKWNFRWRELRATKSPGSRISRPSRRASTRRPLASSRRKNNPTSPTRCLEFVLRDCAQTFKSRLPRYCPSLSRGQTPINRATNSILRISSRNIASRLSGARSGAAASAGCWSAACSIQITQDQSRRSCA